MLIYVLTAAQTGGAGFPLDDAWIHQTYARNLADGGGWSFVPGVPSAGSTSPLYTVLLAIGYGLHIPYFLWTMLLGAAALAAMGLIGARLAERLFPDIAPVGLITGLLLVGAWHLIWAAAAGMETALFGAFSLALIALAWRESLPFPGNVRGAIGHGLLFGCVGALLTLTRPEGVGLVGLCGVLMLIAHPHRSWTILGGWVIGAFIGWTAFVAPDLLLNHTLNGSLLPNTSAAKQAEYAPLLAEPITSRIVDLLTPLSAGGQVMLIPGTLFALYLLMKRAPSDRHTLLLWIMPIWAVAIVLLYASRLPAAYQHGRYVMTALPPFIVLGAGGTLALAKMLTTQPRRSMRATTGRVIARALLIAVGLVFIVFWLLGALTYVRDVAAINADMVTAAKWVVDHVPPGERLAAHDIGALGYFAPHPLFDLAGLVSPEIVPIIRDPAAQMALMQARGVRYLMASPAQLPTAADDPRLCRLYTTPAPDSPIHMSVYWLAWDGQCV